MEPSTLGIHTVNPKSSACVFSYYCRLGVKIQAAKIVEEMPLKRLTELFNANNFIVSQVPSYLTISSFGPIVKRGSFLSSALHLVSQEFHHRYSQFKELGLVPEFLVDLVNIMKLPMTGDVQITPKIYCTDFQSLISNPTPQFIDYCLHKGELAAWQKLPQVKMRCSIEFAIENILRSLSSSN